MTPENSTPLSVVDLRRRIIANRDRLSSQMLAEKSRMITARLLRLPEFTAGRAVMLFASFRSEVATGEIITGCLASGIRVALPLSEPASRRLLPYLVKDLSRDLRPGYCSIPEPDPARTQPLAPAELEIVVVPGSVFDLRGGRFGYGGGFYDRFLSREAPQARRIGLAFELQVVSAPLPLAAHDQLLDCLVTEERTLTFASGR